MHENCHLVRFQGAYEDLFHLDQMPLSSQPLCSMLALRHGEIALLKKTWVESPGKTVSLTAKHTNSNNKTDNGSKQTCCLISGFTPHEAFVSPLAYFTTVLTSLLN